MQAFVYFIRPKPRFNFEDMTVYLSCAHNEEDAWSHAINEIGEEYKHEYYIDAKFICPDGCALGLMWPQIELQG